ncbi:Coiled-coil domain-containing protein [Actinidia chinensis var. chinensis]|uniref:Coiled-coil domain-containing protein n=1 Tax=Actinidia chinensis var. chinensis TaxID=1590841 RepID=A0A2R6Q356_ACTCC|nr:Coiled-coil domain-containing protein [Actinidia chinensis var. chinensis]
MARVLSQTLARISSSPFPNPTILSPRILIHRNRSNQTGKAQLVEVDLESEGGGGGEVEVMGVRKLEDVIHSIIVRRSAPDWLPFIPGSSYWVPARRRPSGVVELVGKLTNLLSDEENMSFTSERGWPSAAYFIEGRTYPVPLDVQVKVEVKVQDNNAPQSEDEEG